MYVVILNWNGRDDTLACLESVARIDYPNFRVIVADNGSSDGSVDAIRRAYPDVHLIENHANLGFAAGNNSAIAHALESGAEFVFLLNNDTVVDPAILSAFVDAAERMPDGGVFGAKIYYYGDKQKLWYAGGYWDAETLSFNEHGAGELDPGAIRYADGNGMGDRLRDVCPCRGVPVGGAAGAQLLSEQRGNRFLQPDQTCRLRLRVRSGGAPVAQDFGFLRRRGFAPEGIFQRQKPVAVGAAQRGNGTAVAHLSQQHPILDTSFHAGTVGANHAISLYS